MLSRIIPKSYHLRFLTIIHSQIYLRNPRPQIPSNPLSSITSPHLFFYSRIFHFYSTTTTTTNNNNNNINNNDNENGNDLSTNFWKLSSETDQSIDSIFGLDSEGFRDHKQLVKKSEVGSESWSSESLSSSVDGDDDRLFREVVVEGEKDVGDHEEGWTSAEVCRPWSFAGDDQEDDLFDVGGGKGEREGENAELELEGLGGSSVEEELESKKSEEKKQLEAEEKVLTAILKGPNHSFGDLIAASGITEAMLDGLIALKDLEGIEGLPPLREIEDMRYEKSMKRSTRAEIERQKQEEVAKARVRQVDEKGRAYGTGRRKCSIARVWVQPGNGKLVVNDKEFDVYFPMLDHRACILRPFSETKTLGMWDVFCTVKGGGVSGQVGAIQLGISRALQNWAPDLRPPLREAGFLTRDSRVVERKKPGKAKARKSFQWVKR